MNHLPNYIEANRMLVTKALRQDGGPQDVGQNGVAPGRRELSRLSLSLAAHPCS